MGPRKFYIDSRKRVSGSHSDFDYQLPMTVEVPKSRCFVDSVQLANVFPSITNDNKYIYLREKNTSNVTTNRQVELTVGSYDGYTLATEVALRLNTGTSLLSNSYGCLFYPPINKLIINNSTVSPAQFSIVPDWVNGDDCYDVIGFVSPYNITGNVTTSITGTGYVNTMPYHTLFLHSDLGLQGDAIGPDNSQSVIRKIVLDQPPGGVVNDFHSLPYDYVTIQPGQIRNLHFRLADYKGRTVDLLHTPITFSLLFVSEDEF